MTTIRSILAATDFSPTAVQASRRAAQLAAQLGARLTLLHVVEPDVLLAVRDWVDGGRDLEAAVLEQARIELAAHAGQLEQEAGVPVRQRLAQGACLKELQAAADEADLVVVGARGAHSVREFVVGSTADRMVRTGRKPMLVVKGDPVQPYARGLVLTDFSPAAQAALEAALALAPQGRVRLLHAYDVPFEGRLKLAGARDSDIQAFRARGRAEAVRQLAEVAATAAGSRVETEAVRGDAYVEMLAHAESLQPHFIAVGKQGTSAVGDFFLGSTTSHVLREAPCDVLVVPAAVAA